MDSWRQYVFSVIVCALICGIVSQILSDTKQKSLIKLICGTFLTTLILSPISDINPDTSLILPDIRLNTAEQYIEAGKKNTSEAQNQRIKASCEAYIIKKAELLEADITANISLGENHIPVSAEIYGMPAPQIQSKLQNILTTDLGIPKEHQTWIRNPENNSS